MASEWHYTQNGQPAEAPVNNVQLKQLAVSGLLKPEDLVWKEGMPNWAPAGSIKGLFDSTKPASGEVPASSPAPAASSRPSKLGKSNDRLKVEAPAPPPEPELEPEPEAEEGLHPFVVFLLTAITFGLFGLGYAWHISSAYARSRTRTIDSAGRPLGKVRHPVGVLLLSYLTLGFYLFYWISKVMQECAIYTERKDIQSRIELSLMLIFPLYAVYLAVYRVPELVRQARARAGLPEEGGPGPAVFFLAPFLIVGIPILCMVQQDTLNQVWLKGG